MKRLTMLFSIAMLLAFVPVQVELSKEDREKAVRELTGTRDYFNSSIAGLSDTSRDH